MSVPRRTAWHLYRRAAGNLGDGALTVVDASGTHRLGAGSLEATMTVHDPAVYRRTVRSGTIGLAESYAEGQWDADDLTTVIRLLSRAAEPLTRAQDSASRLLHPLLDAARRRGGPDRADDRAHIAAHYDLSNRFFELMLDETMTYSCAVFDRPGLSLAEAQRHKLDRLCRKLALSPDDHLLEIGTGWGGLALHAATTYGCRVTTTTISRAQHDLAAKRVADAGLSDRIRVLETDYRDLTGTFDKLVSVEMIEAVDWRFHETFFAACADRLRADGLMALQAITIDDRSFDRAKHRPDFIRTAIFPGGCLPSIESITRSLRRATRLLVIDVEDIGRHYPETLRRWHENLDRHRRDVDALGFDRPFQRRWDLYLSYCEAAFLERHISDVQMVMAMPDWRPPLLTRGPG
jgi:cyclopropane-fatty-acyl-phospholipid synthase